MRSYPRVVDEILKENHQVVQVKEVYHLSYRGLKRNNWVSSTNYSFHFLSELFIIHHCILFDIQYSLTETIKVFECDRGVLKIQKISMLLLMACLFHYFHHVWKKSWLLFAMNSPTFNSRRNVIPRQTFAKKFAERPPAKKAWRLQAFLMFSLRTSLRTFIPYTSTTQWKKNFSSKLLNFPRGTFVIIEL